MLQQLADALKSERRRNKLYEEEILLAEEEVSPSFFPTLHRGLGSPRFSL